MASILSTPCLVLAQEKEESPSAIQHMWDFVKTKAELAWNKVYYYLSFKVEERSAVKYFAQLERILKGKQVAIPVTCLASNEGKVDETKCVIGAENLEERLENIL